MRAKVDQANLLRKKSFNVNSEGKHLADGSTNEEA
jgi:hypothetical protein